MRATTIIRAATAVGLVALLLLAVAALPATAQSDSSFGLDNQSGGDTSDSTTMSGEEQTGGTTASGATVELPGSTSGEATVIRPSEETVPSTTSYDQYQDGYLADTGGLHPLTIRLGLIAFIAAAALLLWRLVSTRSTNNREDDDVFFG